jgi:hypothetical protein
MRLRRSLPFRSAMLETTLPWVSHGEIRRGVQESLGLEAPRRAAGLHLGWEVITARPLSGRRRG